MVAAVVKALKPLLARTQTPVPAQNRLKSAEAAHSAHATEQLVLHSFVAAHFLHGELCLFELLYEAVDLCNGCSGTFRDALAAARSDDKVIRALFFRH